MANSGRRTKHLDFVRVYVVGRRHERKDMPVTSKDNQNGHCYWVRLEHVASTIDKLHDRHNTYKVLRIEIAEKVISSATIHLGNAVICSAKVTRIKLLAKGPFVLSGESTICGVPVFAWGNGRRYQPRGCSCPNGHKLEHTGFVQPHGNTPRKQPSPTQERPRVHIPGHTTNGHKDPTPSVATDTPVITVTSADPAQVAAHTTATALPTSSQTMEKLLADEGSVWGTTDTATSHNSILRLRLDDDPGWGTTDTATSHNSILDWPLDDESGWESSDAEDDAAKDEWSEVPPAAPDAPALEHSRFEPPQDPSYDDLPSFRCIPPGGYPQDEWPSEVTVADTFLFSDTTTILDGNNGSGDSTVPGTPHSITASLHKPADVEPDPDGMQAILLPGPQSDLGKDISQDSHSSPTGFTHIFDRVRNWLLYW